MKTVIDITVAGTLRERINNIDSERIISELKINGTLNQVDKLCIRQLDRHPWKNQGVGYYQHFWI